MAQSSSSAIKLYAKTGLNLQQVESYYDEVVIHLSPKEKEITKKIFDKFVNKCFRKTDTSKHLMTIENSNRFVSRPIVYADVWKMFKLQLSCFWTINDIDFKTELEHFKTLNKHEQHFIRHILAFFAAFDGIVVENIAGRLAHEAQIQEVKSFYAVQQAVEAIHGDVYGELIDVIIPDNEEKQKLFEASKNFPVIKRKENWAKKWLEDSCDLGENVVAFAVIEGVFFSGAFACIYWIKEKNLMPALTLSNEFISRDEGIHRDFACLILRKNIVKLPPREKVIKIITDAVTIEKTFLVQALPVNLIGLSCEKMSMYIEYVADKLLEKMGLEIHYCTSNPLDFMCNIAIENKTNFFERRVSEYQKPDLTNYNTHRKQTSKCEMQQQTKDCYTDLDYDF
uniref:ribonucleoside-diphosphate reductase n=1 Tax=Pasiphaea japonica whispovirus TaxID=2984286 RepID=A0A9C7EZB1_9VIRU|nr:MAG: wsv188-like protein [Pasiphaea japonica whispovirus]